MRKRLDKTTKEILEKAAGTVLTLVIFIILPICAGFIENHYKMNCEVIGVEEDTITIIDGTGNLWDFFGDGFVKGDRVKVTFYTNLSDNTREDDIIQNVVKIRKE